MIKVVHRVNTHKELIHIPTSYGIEVDVRTYYHGLVMNHDANKPGDIFDLHINNFEHKFLIIDVKEEGIEREIIKVCEQNNIKNYFLLGVTFPFMLKLAREGFTKMALRYSEYEGIETAVRMKGMIDWLWVDTFDSLPPVPDFIREHYKIALVSPCRWGRPRDIKKYNKELVPDLVMTEMKHIEKWQEIVGT